MYLESLLRIKISAAFWIIQIHTLRVLYGRCKRGGKRVKYSSSLALELQRDCYVTLRLKAVDCLRLYKEEMKDILWEQEFDWLLPYSKQMSF